MLSRTNLNKAELAVVHVRNLILFNSAVADPSLFDVLSNPYRGPGEPWVEKCRISNPPVGERRPSARKNQGRRGSRCCTTPRSRDAVAPRHRGM